MLVGDPGIEVTLHCPQCSAILRPALTALVCPACGDDYPLDPANGVPDLRLRRPKPVSLDVVVPCPGVPGPPATIDALVPCARPEVDWDGYRPPVHLDRALMSYVQKPSVPGALALDLGCGDGSYRSALERAGYRWVGLDHEPGNASVVGDAQALPFDDETFDAVMSLAVLEHVQHPLLFAREAYRVLRPGRALIGTVAFLEPLHGGSFYHHTHRGLWNTLSSAGFQVRLMATSPTWTVLKAQSNMALFPGMPRGLAAALVGPLDAAHRLWWMMASWTGHRAGTALRLSTTAGAIHFVATRPGPDEASQDAQSDRVSSRKGRPRMTFYVHPHGLCETSDVGEGTRIWAFAHVLPGARLGADCNVCDHVFIENDVIVGDRVTVKSGVQLWDGLRVGDDVFIGPNATFTNDLFPRSKVYHSEVAVTRVEDGASIGANATILPGLTIGARAMVGAGSVVTRDVPRGVVVAGNPARVVGPVDGR